MLISHEEDSVLTPDPQEITENTMSKTMPSGDVVWYPAIELIEGGSAPPAMCSDAYSFAMFILERITEEVLFSGL